MEQIIDKLFNILVYLALTATTFLYLSAHHVF